MNKTIELSDGRSISMYCPTVRVVKNAMKTEDEMEMIMGLISATCNLSKDDVESMPFPDYMKLQEVLLSFLGKAPK